MKLSLVAAASFFLLSSARADVMTPGTPLRIRFKAVVPVQPAPPDTLMLVLNQPFIQAPIGSYTSDLLDGATSLGMYTSTALGGATGQQGNVVFALWKSATSVFINGNPTVVDFTSIDDGSIDGVVEFTIAGGEIAFGLDKVDLQFLKSIDGGSGFLVQPQPYLTSIHLGAFENFCFGDGGLATACPCSNFGMRERGCQNSWVTGGAKLSASGTTSPDTVQLTSTKEPPFVLSIFLQGDATVSGGVLFGDGLRCVGGNLKRLYTKFASNNLGSDGSARAPGMGDLSITAQSAAFGDPIPSGATRYYQVYYRDPQLFFCPSPMGDSWNVGSAVAITW